MKIIYYFDNIDYLLMKFSTLSPLDIWQKLTATIVSQLRVCYFTYMDNSCILLGYQPHAGGFMTQHNNYRRTYCVVRLDYKHVLVDLK